MKENNYNWLVLIYYLPPEAGSVRVRVWRKMKKLGMVSFRNSVYFLPFSEENHEITQWLCQEIQKAEGDATLLKVESVENLSNREVEAFFQRARDEDYFGLMETASKLSQRLSSLKAIRESSGSVGAAEIAGLVDEFETTIKRFNEIKEIDFFDAPASRKAAELIERCRLNLRRLRQDKESLFLPGPADLNTDDYQGKTWATRPRPFVDRIASAWVIKRFVDTTAAFRFADDHKIDNQSIPFDYPGADLSHQGEDCTMETLIRRFGLEDQPLIELSQIVHDIDLKDLKFGRAEAAGLEAILKGLLAEESGDRQLLEQGFIVFDSLYAGLGAGAAKPKAVRKKRKSRNTKSSVKR